jgi:hypothetical protein
MRSKTVGRLLRPILISAALCLILALRVWTSFEPFRVKLVREPLSAAAGLIRLADDGLVEFDRFTSPFVIIARIRHTGAEARRFSIVIDGRAVCSPRVRPGAARRVDCAWRPEWTPGQQHHLGISSDIADWTLEYLEVGTHHGATRSYDLLIVPSSSSRYGHPSVAWIVLALVSIAVTFALPRSPLPRAIRLTHLFIAVLVVVLFVVVIISPVASRFLVLLSLPAFMLGVVVLAAPRLWFAVATLARWRREARWWPMAVSAASAVLVLIAYGRVVSRQLDEVYNGNYSGFIHLSKAFVDRHPLLQQRQDIRQTLVVDDGGGYDAQFTYFAVFDPFMTRHRDAPGRYGGYIDAPPYRFGRIGFILLTKAFSLDQWRLYPATMVWLVVGALGGCALALSAIARWHGASPWWGAAAILIPAFWQSVQVALPEPIAAAAWLGGYLCVLRGRWTWAALAFAVAMLIRETSAILIVCVAIGAFLSGRRGDAVRTVLIAFLPVVLWRLYVAWVLWSDWGIEGLTYHPGLGAPFAGLAKLWWAIADGRYFPGVPEMSRAGVWYPVLLIGAGGIAVVLAITMPGPLSLAAAFYAAIAVSLNYESVWAHVGNGQRVTFELFTALILLSLPYRSYTSAIRALVVLLWIGAGGFVFFAGLDAEYIRQTDVWPVLDPVWRRLF